MKWNAVDSEVLPQEVVERSSCRWATFDGLQSLDRVLGHLGNRPGVLRDRLDQLRVRNNKGRFQAWLKMRPGQDVQRACMEALLESVYRAFRDA